MNKKNALSDLELMRWYHAVCKAWAEQPIDETAGYDYEEAFFFGWTRGIWKQAKRHGPAWYHLYY